MKISTFNVLLFDWNSKKYESYDVLPYFRRCWYDGKYNFDKDKVTDRFTLLNWIKKVSHYQFWARCEYEFLIAPWPFGTKKMLEELQNTEINTDNDIKIYNIITNDMHKIDVHEQIMMNIDIITDILMKEFM